MAPATQARPNGTAIGAATSPHAGLRVILCWKFSQGAPLGQVAEAKQALIASDNVLHSVEVSGSYHFMTEAECPDLPAYQDMMDGVLGRFGHLVDHLEASFVCRRYLRAVDGEIEHLWVPTASGLQRVDHGRIDMVTAEGDYVRVHAGETSWLVHSTMRSIGEQLGSVRFVKINRSLIVRQEFVERLRHERRRWVVRLADGSEHGIAKARSSEVIARLKADSPSRDPFPTHRAFAGVADRGMVVRLPARASR